MKIAKLSRIIASVLMGGLGMAAATPACAQNYPGRPITLILPLGAGTGSDVAFRILAEKMSTAFGQQMVVENAPGAAGIIGAQRVARAAPDGYSLGGFNNAIMAILPNILPSAGYDPFKSFEPVSMVAAIPTALLVHPSLPVSSVKNLIAIAKARPRELNYGTGGVGSPQHIASAMFASMAGIQLVHVPYKSAALAMLDLAGGQLQILIVGLGGTPMSLIKVGKMRPLAATGVNPLNVALLAPRFSRAMSYHGVSSAISRCTSAARLISVGARLKLTGHANGSIASLSLSPSPARTDCGASSA